MQGTVGGETMKFVYLRVYVCMYVCEGNGKEIESVVLVLC